MFQSSLWPVVNLAAAKRFVADATLFIATLDVEPARPVRRQLPPRLINTLQHQFHEPDPIQLRQPNRPVERDHPRLACLHWVCHAAQLIGLDPAPPGTPALLLPTTRVAGWLNLPLPQQIAFLVEALNSPGAAALWRAYRLPGYRALTDESDLRPLTQHLLTARATTRFASVHLTRLLTIPLSPALLSPSPDAQPETLARAIWQAFLWMGLRREHARAEHARAKSSSAHPSPLPIPPSSLQGTLLHMPPEAHTTAWPLGPLSPPQRFALRHHATHRAEAGIDHFTLDPALVQRDLAAGVPVTRLLEQLEAILGDAIPDRVASTVHHWARQLNQVRLSHVTLLEVADADTLAQLTRSRPIRACLGRTLSPRAIVVREDKRATLERRLRWRGHPVPQPSHPPLTRHQPPAAPLVDQHLYRAALLEVYLADLVPLAWRLPHSILETLRTRLTRAQQTEVEHSVQSLVEALSQTPRSVTLPADASLTEHRLHLQHRLEQAIAHQTPLQLDYVDAAGQRTQRVIDPLRLDTHARTPILVAHCRQTQAERHFRLDRIQALTPLISDF